MINSRQDVLRNVIKTDCFKCLRIRFPFTSGAYFNRIFQKPRKRKHTFMHINTVLGVSASSKQLVEVILQPGAIKPLHKITHAL